MFAGDWQIYLSPRIRTAHSGTRDDSWSNDMKPSPSNFWRGIRFLLLIVLATSIASAVLPASAEKQPPPRRVDLNAAGLKELEELPGIGPVMAQRIIDTRQKSGRFRRVEDLLAIRGISQKKLEALRPYVIIVAPPSTPTPQKNNLPHSKTP
jgi:competence ComEA-like helix-hairpin-helix protein